MPHIDRDGVERPGPAPVKDYRGEWGSLTWGELVGGVAYSFPRPLGVITSIDPEEPPVPWDEIELVK